MKLSNKIKGILGALSVATIGSIGGGIYTSNLSNKVAENEKSEMVKPKKTNITEVVNNPIRTVGYRTDTLYNTSSTLLYYFAGNITRNYYEGNNSYRLQLPYFAHEDWHSHNDKIGYRRKYRLSPQEYYKLCMHDEISANLAAILTARYEYLSSKDKKAVIDKYLPTYMNFYFKEIEQKRINPESKNPNDIEKERKFLANETPKMWMRLYAPVYASTNARMVKRYVKRIGIVEDSRQGYKIVKRKMYYMGGVDFASYMDKDIEYYHNDMVSISEEMRKVKTLQEGYKEILDNVENSYNSLNNIHILYGMKAFQHMFVAGKLKYKLRGLDKETIEAYPQIVTACYDNVIGQMRKDKTFSEFIENIQNDNVLAGHIDVETDEYKNIIRKMYTFKDIDLSKIIKDFDFDKIPFDENKYFSLRTENLQLSYPYIIENEVAVNALNVLSMNSNANKNLYKVEAEKNIKQSKKSDEPKKRISDMQYIDIPNLYEPILTMNSNEQENEIYQMMQKFEDMPEVLKGCDTKKQQIYLNMQNKQNQQSR